jgi:UrcA family protein
MKTTLFRSLICAGALCAGDLSMLARSVTAAHAQTAPAGSAHVRTLSPATVRSPTVVRSVRVDLSDLDLSKPHDVRTMRQRIERAARNVCGPPTYAAVPQPDSYLGYETCYRRAVAGALAKAQSAILAQSAAPRVR